VASYRNGARAPAADVVALARSVGARVFVDAYQAVGVLPVDVRELDCDYLVAGALKYLLGIPGLALLYVRGGLTDAVAPQLTGCLGRVDVAAVAEHVGELTAELHETLTAAGERLWSPADSATRGAQGALVDDDPDALAAFLAARRIVTAPRGHVLRRSPHYYNDRTDVTTVCAAIAEYRRRQGSGGA